MTPLKAFIRSYKFELIALIVDISIATITFCYSMTFFSLIILFIIFLLSTFIVIYYKTKEKKFFWLKFSSPGEEQDWVGRGDLKFIRNENCFEITNSHIGYIFPKTSNWDDYRYEIEFKIAKISFGFIVRAVNLSNYIMCQIFLDYIKPHLRINGHWVILDKLIFENKLKEGVWYKLKVVCEKRNVRMQIQDKSTKEAISEKFFIIPERIPITQTEIDENGKMVKKSIFMQEIDFDFGSVGLRNDGKEMALIKNIFIEKLGH